MPEYIAREEFEARVGVLERDVEGEKLVTRYILEQTRRNGDDLASIKTRLGRVETRLDGVENRLGDVGRKVDSLTGTVQGLVKSLPGMIREVLQERGKKR